jgi:hypothetical protein
LKALTRPSSTVTPTVMRNNYTQIFQEAVQVSDRADIVSTYGRKKEFAYQMAKSAAQVKRDREYALIGNAGSQGRLAPRLVASTMAGVQKQLDPTCVTYSGASDGSKPLTEALLVTALKTAYNNGADVDPHHGHPGQLGRPRWLRFGCWSLPHHPGFGRQEDRERRQPVCLAVR